MTVRAIPPDSPVHRMEFFKQIVDSLQVGVIVADHDGRVIYINDTYARFLGIDPAREIGKHATEVVANTRLHIVAQTGQMEINYPHQFKDHGFLVHRVPIRENGRVVAVVGLVLFDSASTASRLAEKVSFLESKVHLYENELISLRSTRYTMDSIVGVGKAITSLEVAGDEGRGHYPAGGDRGRVRHRQGAVRPGHSQCQPAQGPPVRARELRRDPEGAVRVRAVRLRPGGVHGGQVHGQAREDRAGPQRHAVPGRDRRPAARDAAEAPAGAGGKGVRARRRDHPGQVQLPAARGHEPQPRDACWPKTASAPTSSTA